VGELCKIQTSRNFANNFKKDLKMTGNIIGTFYENEERRVLVKLGDGSYTSMGDGDVVVGDAREENIDGFLEKYPKHTLRVYNHIQKELQNAN
jgi:hypothetical protein